MRQLVYNGKDIPGGDISIKDMQKIANYFDEIYICGQASDPILHNDFLSILKCCIGKNVTIYTSATPRSKDYYIELFELSSKYNFKWIFGLDGFPKKNNPYRINQNGLLLFEIMKLGAILGVEVIWSFIYFNFNENEVQQCVDLAQKHDIKFMTVKSSRWFGDLKQFKPTNKNYYLDSLY
jgi:hypothetical protein